MWIQLNTPTFLNFLLATHINRPCFTDRMISSQTPKIFGMDATIGRALSGKPMGNQASYEYPC